MDVRRYIVALCLLAGAAPASAQGNGQISGTIKDSSGGVIPAAAVIITNERTGAMRSAVANDLGYFVVPVLLPSVYTVKAAAPSFAAAEAKGVTLATGESLSINLVLKPAGLSESITVTATQEATTDTTSARIGANVERARGQQPAP